MPHADPDVRRAYQREYQRKWRKANPKVWQAIRQRWWDNNPGWWLKRDRTPLRAASARYRQRHPDRVAASKAKYLAKKGAA